MYVVALAGGIGAGKSLVAQRMRDHGAVTIDLDRVAEDLMRPGSAIVDRLVGAFGAAILREDGTLSRPALAEVAFSSKGNTRILDDIVHPAVIDALVTLINGMRQADDGVSPEVVVVEIPLIHKVPELIELFDEVIAITAPKEVRAERAVARGMTFEDVLARIEVQPTDHERVVLSDTVFSNEGDSAALGGLVDRWWEKRVSAGWRSLRGLEQSSR